MDKKQKIEEVRKQHNCLEFVVNLPNVVPIRSAAQILHTGKTT
jgi:hypothetical protein